MAPIKATVKSPACRIAVCDDEPLHIERIRAHLPEDPIDRYTAPGSLLSAMRAGCRYDVLFLDILMPDMDGLALAREIRLLDRDALIVFITSRIDFVQLGYEARAFRYLLKDQLDAQFPKLWHDITCELDARGDAYFTYEFDKLRHRYRYEEILYFESRLRKVILHTTSGQGELYDKLDRIANSVSGFVRIHQSYLVTKRHIRSHNAVGVVLANGELLPVSRKHASALEALP